MIKVAIAGGFDPFHEGHREEIIHYLHDASPFQETFVIKRLKYKGNFYRVELKFTDATDYERAILYLKYEFEKNRIGVTK